MPQSKAAFPKSLYILYVLIVSALTGYAAVVLYQHFPNMYTWEELFINYEGGFIRRGLLGQVLFLADRVIPVKIGYLLLYTALFYGFLYVSYKKLISVFDPLVVVFLFISPVIFLLPVTDRHVFARKDLFIVIILLGMAQICVQSLVKEKAHLYKNTLCISILFVLGMLIHEMAIFYFPLFAVLLGVAYARQNKIPQWLCITGALFSVTLILSIVFSGDADMREAMCASWRQGYPELTCKRAFRYIGVSFYDNMMNTFLHHTNLFTMLSVFLGLALSALPLLFLWKAYRPYDAILDLLSSSLLLRLAFWPAVCAPIIMSVITNDFGRHISNAFLSYLFFLYAVFAVRPQPAASWLYKFKEATAASSRLRYALYFFAIAYGLCWRMKAFQPVGESYIIPGVLLYLQ